MSLAALYNIFQDQHGLDHFSFSNADHNTQISKAIVAKGGAAQPVYILDPIPKDVEGWLGTHQYVHNNMNNVLGLAGNDLSSVDFQNKSQLASWIWLHAQEHYQAARKLGIG